MEKNPIAPTTFVRPFPYSTPIGPNGEAPEADAGMPVPTVDDGIVAQGSNPPMPSYAVGQAPKPNPWPSVAPGL